MDQRPDLTEQDPKEIQESIEQTRSSLTDKLQTLEGQVRGTVEGAKATVRDTVESVKRTFSLTHQVDHHPWTMFGGSVLTGFILGSFAAFQRGVRGGRSTPSSHRGMISSLAASTPALPTSAPGHVGDGAAEESARASSSGPSLVSKLLSPFDDEIQQLKEVAIGTVVGLLRDVVKGSVPPPLAPEVERIMDNAAVKLGGKPIQGPVVDPNALKGGHQAETRHPSGYANPVV